MVLVSVVLAKIKKRHFSAGKNPVFHFWLGCYYIASLVYSLSLWDLRVVPALIHGSMDFSDLFLGNKVAFIPCLPEKFEKIFFLFFSNFRHNFYGGFHYIARAFYGLIFWDLT